MISGTELVEALNGNRTWKQKLWDRFLTFLFVTLVIGIFVVAGIAIDHYFIK